MSNAPKTTYIATAPDGTEHDRSSARAYTHAVLVFNKTRTTDEAETWGAVSFNGSEELAVKTIATWRKRGWKYPMIVVPVSPKAA
jgi:hypothetical protein